MGYNPMKGGDGEGPSEDPPLVQPRMPGFGPSHYDANAPVSKPGEKSQAGWPEVKPGATGLNRSYGNDTRFSPNRSGMRPYGNSPGFDRDRDQESYYRRGEWD